MRSLFFVLVSYRCTAALKIDWKLDEEEVEGVFETWDIDLIAKQISRQEEDYREVCERQYRRQVAWGIIVCWCAGGCDSGSESVVKVHVKSKQIFGSPLCPPGAFQF